MLLLLTIGLVLVATVALVIGFVTSALAPIYVSIACSVAAALVLFFFSRLSKRDAQVPAAAGPAPLPGPAVTAESNQPGSTVTVLGTTPPAPSEAETTGEVPVVPPSAGEEAFAPEGLIAAAEPAGGDGTLVAEAPASSTSSEPLVGEDEAGAAPEPAFAPPVAPAGGDGAPEEDLVFPIADYDDLRVSEILPLLPELDEDELQMVRERETQGRARFSILTRVDQLTAQLRAATGVPSQGFEEDVAGVGVPSAPPPAPPAPPGAPPAPPEGGWPAPPEAPPAASGTVPVETGEAETDMALAAAAGQGEGVPAAEALDGGLPAAGGELGPQEVERVPDAETVARAFPIADYESKKVTEILPLLTNLGADDLALVAEREQAGKARGSVLGRIDQLRARAADAAPPPTAATRVVEGAAAKKVAAKKAPAKKAAPAAKTAPAKAAKSASKAAKSDKTADKTVEKSADKAPAKKASPRTTKKQ